MSRRVAAVLVAMGGTLIAGTGIGMGSAIACPGPSAGGAGADSTAPQLARATAGPPPLALAACSGRAVEQECTTTGRHGEALSGYCRAVPEQLLACVPSGRHGRRGAGPKGHAERGGG